MQGLDIDHLICCGAEHSIERRTPRSSPSIPEIAALGALSGVAGVQRSTVLLKIMGRSLRWPHPSHRLVLICKSHSQKSHRGGVEPACVKW